jgi:hypothetical protein
VRDAAALYDACSMQTIMDQRVNGEHGFAGFEPNWPVLQLIADKHDKVSVQEQLPLRICTAKAPGLSGGFRDSCFSARTHLIRFLFLGETTRRTASDCICDPHLFPFLKPDNNRKPPKLQ